MWATEELCFQSRFTVVPAVQTFIDRNRKPSPQPGGWRNAYRLVPSLLYRRSLHRGAEQGQAQAKPVLLAPIVREPAQEIRHNRAIRCRRTSFGDLLRLGMDVERRSLSLRSEPDIRRATATPICHSSGRLPHVVRRDRSLGSCTRPGTAKPLPVFK